ncbi:MAG: DsbC family protein [Pseudomonadota bacterium]
MRPLTDWAPVLLLAMLPPALAGRVENELLAQLRQAHPATRFDRVAATPISGLYEVRMGENVAYVGRGNVRYLVFGHLFDVRQMRDLTASRSIGGTAVMNAAAAGEGKTPGVTDLSALPLADAIPVVHGNGTRRLVLFTDPACGYCRQLDETLRQLGNVTILHYLLPFQGDQLPEAIWCAPDRSLAYTQVMASGTSPAQASKSCASPLERNAALAAKLGVHATPTLFFSDGRRAAGVLGITEIEAMLARASGAKTQARKPPRSDYETAHQR